MGWQKWLDATEIGSFNAIQARRQYVNYPRVFSKDVCSGVGLVLMSQNPTTNLYEPRHGARSSALKKYLEMNIEVLSSL